MIYGVFGGEYSDWTVEGYFTNREDAEKYCASRPQMDFYVKDIPEINADVENVPVKYYHTVCFDFYSGMRLEPTRYDYFCGKDKPMEIKHNTFQNDSGWISVSLMADNRDKAEKIAQDIYTKFMAYVTEFGNVKDAAKMIGSTGLKGY